MTSLGKVKVQVWMLILVVFLLGGVTGASIDRLLLSNNRQTPARGGERGGRGRMLEQMINDLSLTDDQTKKVRTIFEDMRKEFPPSRFSECPGVKESREKSRQRIRAILTPEQQKKYDEINAKRDAEINEHKDK